MHLTPSHRRLLIVEPEPSFRDLLRRVAGPHVGIDTAIDLDTAYSRLSPVPPDLLIANLRIRSSVEGLQLAYVVASAGRSTRAIVYCERVDPEATRALQRAGAFYESQERLPYALTAYVEADLPVLDRRDPTHFDRRRMKYRGGRRASDVPFLSTWGSEG